MRGLVVVTLAAIILSGCAAKPDRDRNIIAGATAGATVGAGVGALIGHATGGPPAGWAGAAIGAASGAVIGAAVGSVKPKGCHYRNTRGETWQVPCYDPREKTEACFVGYSEVPCHQPRQ